MSVDLVTAINETTQAVNFAVTTTTGVMDLFLQPPLIFFTGIVILGAAFGVIKGFFRIRRR